MEINIALELDKKKREGEEGLELKKKFNVKSKYGMIKKLERGRVRIEKKKN